MLELLIMTFRKVVPLYNELHCAGPVLYLDESNFTHNTLGQHTTGEREGFVHFRQCLGVIIGKTFVQYGCIGVGPKIVGIGNGFRF